ncbi:hypothetical protein [uncultured Chitinophaga sp.]|uniref:hypothetical protein n=1 Tax=uncultured Chitinophaga sp. TaxID=339340 RepID=UPI0025DDD0B5|nr:hypothetical protein [uncultured Chitinophaga sp.]
MNRSKLIFGAAVCLIASIGAFATAKNTTFTAVWYQNTSGVCLPAQAEICEPGEAFCNDVLVDPDATGVPSLITQIYAAPKANPAQGCLQPYTKAE